jgi:hypothetical protein
MPGPISRPASQFFTGDVTLTAATEVVVLTIPGINTENISQTVRLLSSIQVTTIAGATTLTLRWRRASLTGTLVGEANAITSVASSTNTYTHAVDDNPGEVASLPYVLTATQAGSNSTAIQGEAIAIVSS